MGGVFIAGPRREFRDKAGPMERRNHLPLPGLWGSDPTTGDVPVLIVMNPSLEQVQCDHEQIEISHGMGLAPCPTALCALDFCKLWQKVSRFMTFQSSSTLLCFFVVVL